MRWLLTAVPVIAAATVWAHSAAADPVASFDPAAGEFPEGIAFDPQGNLYVSIAPLGEIRRREGNDWPVHARIDPGTTGLGVLGLAVDRCGTVYAAAPTDAANWHGVVAASPGGAVERLPGSEGIVFPNALAFDHHGNLYVTDSIGGAIWRVPREGSAELWLEHETLAGTGVLGNGFPLGANGIAYFRGRLYVANTEKKQVVEIPIDATGAPGSPSVAHAFEGPMDFLDGISVDAAGNLYVLVTGANELVRIERSGGVTTVAGAAEGLNIPASLVFGTGRLSRTLFVTNFSLPDLTPEPTPGVVSFDVPRPGLPPEALGRCR